jgi:hypothetical protein
VRGGERGPAFRCFVGAHGAVRSARVHTRRPRRRCVDARGQQPGCTCRRRLRSQESDPRGIPISLTRASPCSAAAQATRAPTASPRRRTGERARAAWNVEEGARSTRVLRTAVSEVVMLLTARRRHARHLGRQVRGTRDGVHRTNALAAARREKHRRRRTSSRRSPAHTPTSKWATSRESKWLASKARASSLVSLQVDNGAPAEKKTGRAPLGTRAARVRQRLPRHQERGHRRRPVLRRHLRIEDREPEHRRLESWLVKASDARRRRQRSVAQLCVRRSGERAAPGRVDPARRRARDDDENSSNSPKERPMSDDMKAEPSD